MEDFNIYGWSAIHEASYKGYSNAVTRFLNYARDTGKSYLIELKTCDNLKATPLLIAALGGHFECIQILLEAGANSHETIQYKGKYAHSIVEITVIRQDIDTILYLFDNFNDKLKICEKILNLMKNTDNDDEIRCSISRTLEQITSKSVKKLKDELLEYPNFGKVFTLFVKQSIKHDESLSSSILVILNILKVNHIRKSFTENNGIEYLYECLKDKYLIFREEIEKGKKVESSDENSEISILTSLETFESCNLMIASIGTAFSELSKYPDCIQVIIKENYGEKIIEFIKLLFDSNNLYRKYVNEVIQLSLNRKDTFRKVIIFEQYIHPYLTCLGNLVFASDFYKTCFNRSYLYEDILDLWCLIQLPGELKQEDRTSRLNSRPSSVSSSQPNQNNNEEHVLFKKASPFDFIPSKYTEIINASAMSIVEPAITPSLAKQLKLSIISSIGKVMYQNNDLKNVYFYPAVSLNASKEVHLKCLNTKKNWYNITSEFISKLVDYLDPNKAIERDIRLIILQFFINIYYNDAKAIRNLLDCKHLGQINMIVYLRNLLRKRCAILVREESMRTIWRLAGADDIYFTQDFKILIYSAIGTQYFVDSICDSDYLSLIALEAINVIASGPPFRESQKLNEKLIKGTEEVSRFHSIPAVIRLLKTKDEVTMMLLLKTISSCCVTIGYDNNYRNQMAFLKLGTLPIVYDLCQKRGGFSKWIKSEAYLCLGSLVLNNVKVRHQVYKVLNEDITGLINVLLMMLLGIDEESTNEKDHAIDILEYRIQAGLTISLFSYRCDEFRIKLVRSFDKIPWKTFENILESILIEESKFKLPIDDLKYLRILKLKCLLGFQTASLYKIIDSAKFLSQNENDDPDPRAVGIKILTDLIQYSKNSYIRTIASDFICRLINTDRTLVEPLVTVDCVEILCKQLEDFGSSKMHISVNEIGNCAITLANLVDLSADGRRRIIKLARKVPNITKYLKYYNKTLNLDLLAQWDHYDKLLDMVKNKYLNPKLSTTLVLPLIKKNNKKSLRKLVNLKL